MESSLVLVLAFVWRFGSFSLVSPPIFSSNFLLLFCLLVYLFNSKQINLFPMVCLGNPCMVTLLRDPSLETICLCLFVQYSSVEETIYNLIMPAKDLRSWGCISILTVGSYFDNFDVNYLNYLGNNIRKTKRILS